MGVNDINGGKWYQWGGYADDKWYVKQADHMFNCLDCKTNSYKTNSYKTNSYKTNSFNNIGKMSNRIGYSEQPVSKKEGENSQTDLQQLREQHGPD